jgi:flagellin-specific chaperone FliS
MFQLHRGGQFLLVEKTTDLSQVTDKLYQIMFYRMSEIRTHNDSGDMY